MENNKTQYWKGLDELNREESFEKQRYNEFAEKLPLAEVLNENEMNLSSTRRDFLKFMGFSISAATLAACHTTPIKKVIPYVFKPETIDPGIADYYASTCSGCESKCSLLVKTRDGRPIKIEGNPDSLMSMGGVCSVGQGSVLSLYDNGRLDSPWSMKDKKAITMADLDKAVIAELKSIAASGGQIRILSGTVNSPSTLAVIKEFTAKYPTAKHVSYDAVSSYALMAAHGMAFGGKNVIPNYKIDASKAIVSFGADFLGSWISPVEFTKQYSTARKVDDGKEMLTHFQFETTLTLTGSNADTRVPLAPSQYGNALAQLHDYVANGVGGAAKYGELMGNSIKAAAQLLLKNKGKSIVITDSNNVDHQLIVASINSLLGNYGTTIDIDNPSYQRTGNDKEMINLVNEMDAGKIGAIIIYDTNPAYTYPDAKKFAAAMGKVKLSISMNDRKNETAELCSYIAPDHHFLESWNDSMPKEGHLSISQPTISPIFTNNRSAQESLLTWMEKPMSYHDYIQEHWKANYFNKQTQYAAFDQFWLHSVERGVVNLPMTAAKSYTFGGDINAVISRATTKGNSDIELVIYQKIAIRDGKDANANNPWLHEVPDPVSKVCWDNYAMVSPKWADELGLKDEDVIDITMDGRSVKLPVLRQPGQRYKTIAVAVGYGRNLKDANAGKVINEVKGGNVYPFVSIAGDTFAYSGMNIKVSKTGETYPLALTQTHHHMEGRDIVRETTVAGMAMGNFGAKTKEEEGMHRVSMYRDYRFPGHHWGMVIDLNACTGCNACVVSCNAENNIPVVGKDEVRRRREMHWMRIDRYYAIAETDKDAKGNAKFHDKYKELDALAAEHKEDYENVRVVFQPLLCQHCENAPCENVCPVNAISHSSEGINQQVYNRCVGTRYCANNCPYKVRRFNWFKYYENDKFDYTMNSDLSRMVLNPDVTVRARGVMEKCSLCVQRIQLGKLEAKKDGRALKDGEIKTACQQTCPANAIVFGDMNNPDSEISKLVKNKRTYTILDDLNTRPVIHYMSKVRSTEQSA